MIVFFVGTPGSGKTYEAVKKIVDNLRMGRVVCTNIDGMDDPACQQYLKDYLNLDDSSFRGLFRFLTKEQVMCFWKTSPVTKILHKGSPDGLFSAVTETTEELICPVGSLIIIDEVHKFYNARDWQASASRELGDWASTHRHNGYDLVLITQSIDKCDKQVRTLTEWTYFFRKINFLGSMVSGRYMKYSYSGDDHDGKPLAKNVGTYQGYVFPAYKSYSNADAKEVGFMTHINVLKHPVFYAIPLVLCLCLYMFFAKSSFATGDIFGAKKSQEKFKGLQSKVVPSPSQSVQLPISSARVPSAVRVPLVPVVAIAPPAVPEYVRYKVDAVIIAGSKTYIMVNGLSVALPHPDILSYSRASGSCMARASFFGEAVQRSYAAVPVITPVAAAALPAALSAGPLPASSNGLTMAQSLSLQAGSVGHVKKSPLIYNGFHNGI